MISKEEAKKKYGSVDPNKKNNFINWDAIDALPDELEVVFSELKFDPNKLNEYFTNVGSKQKPSWYPQTDTMYRIAEFCNIVGEKEKIVEWIYEEVDYNIVLCKPDTAEPTMRKIKTGARVTKQSRILCEDNTWRLCAPETNEYNFFNRACLEFLNDEEYNKGQKYNSPIRRKKRILELEKFAVQQAETKAFCKTVRVLAALPTGFDTEDLKDGVLIFNKFIKSKRIQKLETAARIEAIRNGKTGELAQITDELYNEQQIEAPIETVEASQEITPDESILSKFDYDSKPESAPKKVTMAETFKPKSEDEKIKDLIKEYIKPGTKNRKTLENKPHAMDTILDGLEKHDKGENVDLKNLLSRIEGVTGIQKIIIAEEKPDDGELF